MPQAEKRKGAFVKNLALALAFVLTSPAFACSAASAESHSSVANTLGFCEGIVFGCARANLPLLKRLEALEQSLFQGTQGGSMQDRLQAIKRFLQSHSSGFKSFYLTPEANDSGLLQPLSAGPALSLEAWLMQEAARAFECGEFDRAHASYRKVLEYSPENVLVFYNLGVIDQTRASRFYQRANFSSAAWFARRARDYFLEGLSHCPDDPECLTALGQSRRLILMADQGQNNIVAQRQEMQARSFCLAAVNDAAKDYACGRFNEAINKLSGVLRMRPNDAGVHYGLAQSLRARAAACHRISDLNQALKHASLAQSIEPENDVFLKLLCEISRECSNMRGV